MAIHTLVRGGTVITMDPQIGDLYRGDVLIDREVITAVGETLDAPGATVVDASGMVVMPGLIDRHRHLWYQGFRGWGMDATMRDFVQTMWPRLGANITPEDLYAFMRAGIVDAMGNGITTVLDCCHAVNTPDHAFAAARAHTELPMRAVIPTAPDAEQDDK